MSLLKRKKNLGHYNVLTDNYVPASLPSYGQGLENFVTSEYSINKPEVVAEAYCDIESHLDAVIATCDRHSVGSECDQYINAKHEHTTALLEAEIADHESQIIRIRSAREMRKASLERMIAPLKEKSEKLKADIKPLEDLHAQFQLHIGRHATSIGLPITIIAMIVDAIVNYSFLQTILLSNAALLLITVICMSVMSDGSMWALGTFLSHKGERFTSKPIFHTICISLASMFLLSVITSVMIRYGSMDSTYGTINAAGEFVGKESYSLAEYGVTLITAFVTTATGVLSFAFSLDENAFSVSMREKKKKELAQCIAELEPLLNELALLENAPDPIDRDNLKRTAAEHQIIAIRTGLKLHCRKLMTVRVSDPNFTERMAESGEELTSGDSLTCTSTDTATPVSTSTIIRNKAC